MQNSTNEEYIFLKKKERKWIALVVSLFMHSLEINVKLNCSNSFTRVKHSRKYGEIISILMQIHTCSLGIGMRKYGN